MSLNRFRSRYVGNLESLLQNIWQDIIAEMSQVLTVGSESLAASFATGNNYTHTAECNRRFSFHERAPNVPFKLCLCLCEDLVLVHFDRVASARECSNPPWNFILHSRRLQRIFLSQGHEVGRLPPLLFESLRYSRGGLDLLPLSHDRSRPQLGAQDAARLHLLAEDPANHHTSENSG